MEDRPALSSIGNVAFGPFCLNPRERSLTRAGERIEIGGRSLDLLTALVEQPGKVLSKRELLQRVWPDVIVEDGSLRFHMVGLRRALGDGEGGARYIATQVGVGYAFVAPVQSLRSPPVAEPAAASEIEHVGKPVNLPPRLSKLIGREPDLALLEARVVETPLFTILGSGGVGKTSLAIEVGHRLVDRFEGQVVFVDFGMLENPALVPSMIAGAMGIGVLSEDPLAVILGHLRDLSFLLVLDNCEHIIEPAARMIERIIDECPGVRVLATSREPLRIRDEHIHRLHALDYPEDSARLSREELLAYPAVQLFWERASAADSSMVFDADAARLIGDMCQRLDGMALPIELAAVRVATHGISATAHQLGERFSLSWSGRRTAQPRQQTLQAMLDWSHDLLSPVERLVLARLSVFVGPFSIDASLAVVGDGDLGSDVVVAALDALVAKSLVTPNRARNGTYRLLEMTRAYAREKLSVQGSEAVAAVARRHAAYYLSELEAIPEEGENALEDMAPLRQQLGNIRGALAWSFGDDGDSAMAVRFAAASAPVFLNLSHLIECRGWCAQALGQIEDSGRGTATELELQGALGLSLMFTRGNSHAAGAALDRALEIATLLEDRWNELRMLGRLHIFHERIGDYAIAVEHAERAVRVAEHIGEPEAFGIAYSLSGISQHLAGDQARARRELELSLANSPPSQRSRTIHYGFDHRNRSGIALARALWLSGYPDGARRVVERTVAEAERLDHPVTHCIALIWSLTVHLWDEDFASADAALAAFAACAHANALGPYIAAAVGFHGELAIERGATGEAIDALEESLSRMRDARYELQTTLFSLALARALKLDGRFDEARAVVDTTMAGCRLNGELFAMPELMRIKAEILHGAHGDRAASEALLREARDLARAQSAQAWDLRAATALADLLLQDGRQDEARSLLADLIATFPSSERSPGLMRAQALLTSANGIS